MVDYDRAIHAGSNEEFGRPVTYWPQAAPDVPLIISGIFQRQYAEFSSDSVGMPVSTRHTALGIMDSDLMGQPPRQGDRLTVNGTDYVVDSFEPNGHGRTWLKLKVWKPERLRP